MIEPGMRAAHVWAFVQEGQCQYEDKGLRAPEQRVGLGPSGAQAEAALPSSLL